MKNYSLTLLVLLAFGAMVFFSYSYVSSIENKHLIRNSEDAFHNTWLKIEADLQEPKSALAITSQTIRNMLVNGDASRLQGYFSNIANLFSEGEFLNGFDGFYSRIYNHGDFDGWGRTIPEGHETTERPWYIGALEAKGKIAITAPYKSIGTGEVVITYSCLIFGNDNEPLGVIALDVKLDRIGKYAVDTHIYEGSYGILTDGNFQVIAHPNQAYLGMPLSKMNDGPAIQKELEEGKTIYNRKATDHLGRKAVMFVRKLDNGWYMAVFNAGR